MTLFLHLRRSNNQVQQVEASMKEFFASMALDNNQHEIKELTEA